MLPTAWKKPWDRVYCCPTAAIALAEQMEPSIFLRVLQAKREPTNGLEPLTCSSYE
jgi:hypothetical protein